MKGIIKSIKKIFGVYDIGSEYWININKIKVNP